VLRIRGWWSPVVLGVVASAVLTTGAASPSPAPRRPPAPPPPVALPSESEQAPPTDCTAPVGVDPQTTLPGYLVSDDTLGVTCVPFRQEPLAPPGYQGDYRVDAFSDQVLRDMLAQCEAQPPCSAIANAHNYQPTQFRLTGSLVPEGKIDPHAPNVDLREIRRPGFFGQAPYHEPIAEAEERTYTFEFTVPAEPYERLNRGITTPVKLRGWYLRGAGVQQGNGHRVQALAIFVGGRSVETTTVQDPRDPLYTRSASTGRFENVTYPARGTEQWAGRHWRQYLNQLNQAGFDVLTFDKRGHGISGGITADNVLQQGLDMLRAIDALGSGDGVRIVGPDGRERSGRAAVRALVPNHIRHLPIVLGGPSQGSAATMWAMHANFNRWCELDLHDRPCHRPWGHNVTGAVLLSGFPIVNPTLAEAARRKVNHIVGIATTSEPLAGIGSWPAVFFGKGLFDGIQGPFLTFNAYLRVRGDKDLVFVRGPHSEVAFGAGNLALMQDRVAKFAVRAVLGQRNNQPTYRTLREAVAASPQIWEPSTQPTFESTP
jgi:pimeloyl-ACP methyl ester carboxylesterase